MHKNREKKATKEAENSSDFIHSIDTLFKCIFLKKEQSEKVDVDDVMKNLTSNEFEDILDQIQNDNENENKQQSNTLKDEFCKGFNGFASLDSYYVSSLSSIENDYKLIYQDFLSINNKLIDGELKDLLLKHSNNNTQDIDLIYDKKMQTRNICCLFPYKHWDKYLSIYISLIDRLNRNKNDKLKMFCILYNCIANIFVNGDTGKSGLDTYIYKYNEKSGNGDLNSLCEWYVLIEMIKTGIFGNDKKLTKNKTYHYGKDVYSSQIVTFIISNIFDNDLTSFKKLCKYCTQDIKYNSDVKKLKDIYKLNDKHPFVPERGVYGIQFYVLNRFFYVVYHDLLCMNMKLSDNELLFPLLKNFYSFLYNFSVYCHCYVHYRYIDHRKEYEGSLYLPPFSFSFLF